jgi:hypothetical protein
MYSYIYWEDGGRPKYRDFEDPGACPVPARHP